MPQSPSPRASGRTCTARRLRALSTASMLTGAVAGAVAARAEDGADREAALAEGGSELPQSMLLLLLLLLLPLPSFLPAVSMEKRARSLREKWNLLLPLPPPSRCQSLSRNRPCPPHPSQSGAATRVEARAGHRSEPCSSTARPFCPPSLHSAARSQHPPLHPRLAGSRNGVAVGEEGRPQWYRRRRCHCISFN